MTPPLAVTDVTISLSGRPVVHGVDLTVESGAFVALLGTNGSGKSTLMRAAVGLIPIDSGSIELFGTPIGRFREFRRLGYVPQKSTATSGVPSTIREVVMSGRLSRRRYVGWPTREDRRAVDEAIELVGLSDRAGDSAAQLSGGQQQRVMIARGLAGRCDLLVMDEPTAGVDVHSQQILADVLRRIVSEGRSVWMIAHELGPIAPLVDHAVVLRDGRVEYAGAPRRTPHDHDGHHHDEPEEPNPAGIEAEGAWSP